MIEQKSLQCILRERSLNKIKTDLLSILVNPYLKGKVHLLLDTDPSDDPSRMEVNFGILYEEGKGEVKKAHACFRFDSRYPEEGPVCIEVERGEGSTSSIEEIWPQMQELGSFDLEKTLVAIVCSLGEGDKKSEKSESEVKKVNLPVIPTPNKNQSFIISNNSSFSRIPQNFNPITLPNPKFEREEHKDSNSTYMKWKRNSKPMKKNANLPKFLIRIFIKYLDRFKKIYPKREFDRLYNDCKKMKEWKRTENKQHALGLKHLKQLFQEEKMGYPQSDLNRKVIIKIISDYLLEQICQNSQIPETHRLGYLVACRVYALRCRNSSLAGRIQSK